MPVHMQHLGGDHMEIICSQKHKCLLTLVALVKTHYHGSTPPSKNTNVIYQ